jgi:hypothetical protein
MAATKLSRELAESAFRRYVAERENPPGYDEIFFDAFELGWAAATSQLNQTSGGSAEPPKAASPKLERVESDASTFIFVGGLGPRNKRG